MEQIDVAPAFISAAEFTAGVLGSSQVAEHWGSPSALPGFSVGGLAGHTYLATRLVDRRLTELRPEGARLRRPGEYYETMRVDDVARIYEDEEHRRIRRDGEYVARRGAAPLVAKFTELIDRLRRRLALERPDRLLGTAVPGVAARLDDFLANRTVELLVHADDLATSVGIPEHEPPELAASLAIASLMAVTRERIGDRAVLRVLSGRDRRSPDLLRTL
jgi:uncharacterized protein (TIGR03083 family)